MTHRSRDEVVSRLEQISGDYQYRAVTEGFRVQRYWHLAKQRLIDARFPLGADDTVLDIGCGSGVIANFVAERAAFVHGVDGSGSAIEFARSTFERPNLSFEHGVFDDIDPKRGAFNAAICMEVLEHLDPMETERLLSVVHLALRPGGRLLVTTPNYRGVWPMVEWVADRSGLVAHLEGDQHVARYGPISLRKRLHQAGFEVSAEGTYCTVAPVVSLFRWSWADQVFNWELRANLPFGALLYAIGRRR